MTDTFFFISSKIFWFVFSPDTLLVILLCLCLLLFWFKATRIALVVFHFIVAAVLLITFLPIGKWLFYPLEKQFLPIRQLPVKVDGVLMLGGAEKLSMTRYWRQPELNQAAERYTAFVYLANTFPTAKHVFSGGIGNLHQDGFTAADVAGELFNRLGMNTSRIIFESGSRNTYENAVFTKQMIQPSPGETWILVTSAFHMPRSVGIFSKLGWEVIPYPVDHRTRPDKLLDITIDFVGNLKDLRMALHEWTGLFVYFMTGKSVYPFRTGQPLLPPCA